MALYILDEINGLTICAAFDDQDFVDSCYRNVEDLRCIVFVERVITAMVLEAILDNLLFEVGGWRTKYIAGNQSALKSQSRNEQNKIVQEFRSGTVRLFPLSIWHISFLHYLIPLVIL